MIANPKSLWIITFAVVGMIAVIIYSQWSRKILYNNINKNRAYAIATIIKYAPPSRSMNSGVIRVEFFIDGYSFEASSRGGFRSPGVKIPDFPKGKQYLIIYDAKNPENCSLLWDYPIKDSSDYKRYIQYLEKHPIDLK